MEEKLLKLGYKIWEKGEYKRIYINDVVKYCEVIEKEEDSGQFYDVFVNGINTLSYSISSRKELKKFLNGDYSYMKLYYDCKKDVFISVEVRNPLCKEVFNTVVNKLKNL